MAVLEDEELLSWAVTGKVEMKMQKAVKAATDSRTNLIFLPFCVSFHEKYSWLGRIQEGQGILILFSLEATKTQHKVKVFDNPYLPMMLSAIFLDSSSWACCVG